MAEENLSGMLQTNKRRRTSCHGDQCGQPDCDNCTLNVNEDGTLNPSDLEGPKPSQIPRTEALLQAENPEPGPATRSAAQYQDPATDQSGPNSYGYALNLDPIIPQMVAELDEQRLRFLVHQLAIVNPWVVAGLIDTYKDQLREREKLITIVNFDHLSKRAWHALNDRSLLRSSGSRQYDAAGDVWDRISSCVDEIQEGCNQWGFQTPLRTRQSALETLRKIAKTIILGEDTIGHEVRKELQHDSCIADVMRDVLDEMSVEERIATGKLTDEKGSLVEKVRWVRDEARAHCLSGLDGLDGVLEMLETGEVGDESSEGAESSDQEE